MTVYAHSIWDTMAPHVDENGNDIWPDGTPWYPVTRPQDRPGAATMPEEGKDTTTPDREAPAQEDDA